VARFLNLSKMRINVDAIRLILPGMVKAKDGETFGCTVYFTNAPEAYAFYGDDAKKILEVTSEQKVVPETETVAG
jgi:hypothetical protein